ncbi:MAG: beta-lactamase family protein [Candidatus Thorarchaeota archaeon]|nr:MAG: beta-lactamase family protein [Candidatus Thorarchaeota archaeon]
MIDTEKIHSFIDKLEREDKFSGTVLIAKDNETVFERAYGLASKTFSVPNTIETKFNLGSLNKIFTKVAILQLMQESMLELDDRVEKFLPDYPSDAVKRSTVRHLINHTSGLGHYWTQKFRASNGNLRTVDDFVRLFQDDLLLFEPGERKEYSNNGYVLLGKVIEILSGQSYYNYIKDRIYKLAGMHSTDHFELDSLEPDLATGYTIHKDDGCCPESREQELRNNIFTIGSKGSPAGGGFSTVHDMLRFDIAAAENKLLAPEYSAMIFRPIDGEPDSKLPRLILQAGGAAGVSAFYAKYPYDGYIAVILSNYDPENTESVEKRIRDEIIGS